MGKKKPRIAIQPFSHGKTPRLGADPESFHKRAPSWRVQKLEMVDPFGWHAVDRDTANYIKGKLGEFETMTWGVILNSRNNHNVSVEKICKDAQERLTALRQDDIEEVLSLRLSGKHRIWGILSEGVCTLLWWDPEHRICPSLRD